MKDENKKESAEELFEKAHNKFRVLKMAMRGILDDLEAENVPNENEMIALNDFLWEIDSLFEDCAAQMEYEDKTNDEDTVKGIERVLECVKEGAFRTKEAAVKHLKEHAVPLDGIIERAAQLKKRAEKTKTSFLNYIDQLEAGGK